MKRHSWSDIRWRETEIKAGALDENKIYSDEIYGDADLSKSSRLIEFAYYLSYGNFGDFKEKFCYQQSIKKKWY